MFLNGIGTLLQHLHLAEIAVQNSYFVTGAAAGHVVGEYDGLVQQLEAVCTIAAHQVIGAVSEFVQQFVMGHHVHVECRISLILARDTLPQVNDGFLRDL